MPFNPLMVNKRVNLPKEKPKVAQRALGERIFCWVKLGLAALLATGDM